RVRDLLWGGELLPPPVQDQVPIWLGYQGPQGARRAGRLGVGLLSTKRELRTPYRDGLVEGGHDPSLARMGGVGGLLAADGAGRGAAVGGRTPAPAGSGPGSGLARLPGTAGCPPCGPSRRRPAIDQTRAAHPLSRRPRGGWP